MSTYTYPLDWNMWNDASTTLQVICLHSTQSGGARGSLDWMHSQQSGSYHWLIDLNGDAYQMVPDTRQAWAAMSTGNRIGLHLCATGYSAWMLRTITRVVSPQVLSACGFGRFGGGNPQWATYPAMIESLAEQTLRWSRQYDIPLIALTGDEVRAGKRGVCRHADISAAFGESDHTDPGANLLPLVLDRALQLANPNLAGLSDSELSMAATNFRQLL